MQLVLAFSCRDQKEIVVQNVGRSDSDTGLLGLPWARGGRPNAAGVLGRQIQVREPQGRTRAILREEGMDGEEARLARRL